MCYELKAGHCSWGQVDVSGRVTMEIRKAGRRRLSQGHINQNKEFA